MIRVLTFLFMLTSFSSSVLARPVAYAGGWMAMLMNDTDRNAGEVSYSPTAFYSVGAMHEYRHDEKYNADFLTFNLLAKRWNLPTSQANIFIKSGAGVAYGDDDSFSAFTGIEADWESRRFLTLYENRFYTAESQEKFVRHTARIGVAPYLGNSGDLHSWVMLQADYQADDNDKFTLTPMVRLFKGTNLIEAGYNLHGGATINFTKQF